MSVKWIAEGFQKRCRYLRHFRWKGSSSFCTTDSFTHPSPPSSSITGGGAGGLLQPATIMTLSLSLNSELSVYHLFVPLLGTHPGPKILSSAEDQLIWTTQKEENLFDKADWEGGKRPSACNGRVNEDGSSNELKIWKPPDEGNRAHLKQWVGSERRIRKQGRDFVWVRDWFDEGALIANLWVSDGKEIMQLGRNKDMQNLRLDKMDICLGDNKGSYFNLKRQIKRPEEEALVFTLLLKPQIRLLVLYNCYTKSITNEDWREMSILNNQNAPENPTQNRLVLSSSGGRGISMLLGKMLTEAKVNLVKARVAAQAAWSRYGEVGVQMEGEMGSNLLIFTFQNVEVRNEVWENRPWCLSGNLTALRKWEGRGRPSEIPIKKLAIWVQIHDLPQFQGEEENMKAIDNIFFPKLLSMDLSDLDYKGYRKFVRILVEVDINEPLPAGFDNPIDAEEEETEERENSTDDD